MKRTPVESSMIASIGYDEKTGLLEIGFTSGTVYEYYDVPKTIVDGLMGAGSHGRYFLDNIKDDFDYGKVRKR